MDTFIKQIENYKMLKIIGKGAFAIVYHAINIKTSEEFAIKEIYLDKFDPKLPETKKIFELFCSEVEILKTLNHPNIIKMFECIYLQNFMYIVFEYCALGDLEKHIKNNNNRMSENDAKPIIMQLLEAMKMINQMNIVHRDIKLANVLIDQNFQIKLADFGFAKLRDGSQLLQSYCGTPLTMAPEIIILKRKSNYYDEKCDIWSLGVVIFQLIYGKVPFMPEKPSIEELIKLINKQQLQFPNNIVISKELQDLLKAMLINKPEKRISFKELFQHKWYTQNQKFNSKQQSQIVIQSLFQHVNLQFQFYQNQQPKIDQVKEVISVNQFEQIMINLAEQLIYMIKLQTFCENFMKKDEIKQDSQIFTQIDHFLNEMKKFGSKLKITLQNAKQKQEFRIQIVPNDLMIQNSEPFQVKLFLSIQFKVFDLKKQVYHLCLKLFVIYLENKEVTVGKQLLLFVHKMWKKQSHSLLLPSNQITISLNEYKTEVISKFESSLKSYIQKQFNIKSTQVPTQINQITYQSTQINQIQLDAFHKLLMFRIEIDK